MRKLIVLLLFAAACGKAESNQSPRSVEAAPAPPKPRCVSQWTAVADGIEYRTLNCSPSRNLHLVRLDPSRVEFAARVGKGGVAEAVSTEQGWSVAINANFFDHDFRPLGIVVNGGKRLNRMHPVDWESVFFVTKKREPGIVLPENWPGREGDAEVAVQAGPRIVVDSKPLKVVPGKPDSRSGVCIGRSGEVILFATPAESLFNAQELAGLAASDPTLACRNAMLFDGGPSTQLFVASKPPVTVDGDKAVPVLLLARSRS